MVFTARDRRGFRRYNQTTARKTGMTHSPSPPSEVTRLLAAYYDGDQQALDRLLPLVYAELRRLAGSYLRRERPDHTLQATALVHEAYLRLVGQEVPWQSRAHFFGVAAQMMRRILVDHARRHMASKRPSSERKLSLDEAEDFSDERAVDLIALDEALGELAKIDPQKSRIVELRYFGGLSVEETAGVMGVSVATLMRHWAMAKMWLYKQVSSQQ